MAACRNVRQESTPGIFGLPLTWKRSECCLTHVNLPLWVSLGTEASCGPILELRAQLRNTGCP